jgi:hypothetical protein
MSKSQTKKVDIYLTVDFQNINGYFNPHDPAPLYKRQINHKLEEYIMATVANNKRYSVIFYKLNCTSAVDKQYAEPLMYAIHRHFAQKKQSKQESFQKFKRRNYMLLVASFLIVLFTEAFLPLIIPENFSLHAGLKNCLDVFSWVILWRPIYELIFDWNPHLKEISLCNKLATAEVIMVDKNKNSDTKQEPKTNHSEAGESKTGMNLKTIFQYE